ncbi:hypothetical protein SCHPADRAFT_838751 [Schizopora paradoxa]|uniref:Nucleolar protein 16 n=1 Tax=Schizopora paradoxa TaxID=27342 RepID=A0A0H2R2B5_9AGAM|nr:hypothetical protein SCHPADRAFT_838751 [Schizopora paradoxa]
MANPRQRRKARSSSYKPVQHSRRGTKLLKKHPPIKGPKTLQDAWDKHKTVRQNYAALGLLHTLSPNDSGGRDITHEQHNNSGSSDRPESHQIAGNGRNNEVTGSAAAETIPNEGARAMAEQRTGDDAGPSKLPRGFGKIVRDASGNVIDIELGEEEKEGLMEDESIAVGGQPESWVLGNRAGGGEAIVVRALEEEASRVSKKVRETSGGEAQYLSRLTEAHGADYASMARDVRLNPMQYTAGQLRRAFCRKG